MELVNSSMYRGCARPINIVLLVRNVCKPAAVECEIKNWLTVSAMFLLEVFIEVSSREFHVILLTRL